ncbi:hypothetical protein ABN16_02770 [Levilactobacillus koreensis]|uniref:Uncharacterized protein n=1 Tax=Levilactobacillus koreensis TaxID=637971 RepID=A0AAC9EQX2_9LACO|nr:hypothetical protein ABN16_02770 [Levilactobacillus koreensis]
MCFLSLAVGRDFTRWDPPESCGAVFRLSFGVRVLRPRKTLGRGCVPANRLLRRHWGMPVVGGKLALNFQFVIIGDFAGLDWLCPWQELIRISGFKLG